MWQDASLMVAFVALGTAIWLVLRARRLHAQVRDQLREFRALQESNRLTLQELVAKARAESERLELATRRAQGVTTRSSSALVAIEELGDSATPSDPRRMAEVAENLPPAAWPGDTDLFGENNTALAVAHLIDQGHAPTYIAQHLGLSLGDVELLASLRTR